MSQRLLALVLLVALAASGAFALQSSTSIRADDAPESCASPSPSPTSTEAGTDQEGCPGNSPAAHQCPHDDGDDETHGDHGRCVSQAAHSLHASPTPSAAPTPTPAGSTQGNGHGGGHNGNGHGNGGRGNGNGRGR